MHLYILTALFSLNFAALFLAYMKPRLQNANLFLRCDIYFEFYFALIKRVCCTRKVTSASFLHFMNTQVFLLYLLFVFIIKKSKKTCVTARLYYSS